jgi:hypothetical protein
MSAPSHRLHADHQRLVRQGDRCHQRTLPYPLGRIQPDRVIAQIWTFYLVASASLPSRQCVPTEASLLGYPRSAAVLALYGSTGACCLCWCDYCPGAPSISAATRKWSVGHAIHPEDLMCLLCSAGGLLGCSSLQFGWWTCVSIKSASQQRDVQIEHARMEPLDSLSQLIYHQISSCVTGCAAGDGQHLRSQLTQTAVILWPG